MDGLKKCKQCGEVKSETLFREYYGRGANKGQRTGSRYRTCRSCESINSRYKYLTKKEELTEGNKAEIKTYEDLFDLQRTLGFKPPATQEVKAASTQSAAEELMAKYKNMQPAAKEAAQVMPVGEIPSELRNWMDMDFSGREPEEVQEAFDETETKYRPQTGLDSNLVPVYDNTYKAVLDKIQDRIDDYEDDYYMD